MAAALESLNDPELGQQSAASSHPGLNCKDRAPDRAFRLRILQSETSVHFQVASIEGQSPENFRRDRWVLPDERGVGVEHCG
jgi:hypothetical protein